MIQNKMKRLSAPEMAEATARRKQMLRSLDRNGVKYAEQNQSKPYLGSLSPGCVTCVNGTWSCIFINSACTRECFYCPRDRDETDEGFPCTEKHAKFASAEEYVRYLERFHFEGIGFSGGEPLLAFHDLRDYIEAIRRHFGEKHYVWIYTNGDLVTEERLQILRDAGLREIRFDISANGYITAPVSLASDHIGTVSIEIPAIPEDLELVKSKLPEFEKIGVKHLNVHQLMATKFNCEAFVERGYTLTNVADYDGHFPVVESELAALELLEYAAKKGFRIGVNYCSRCYKARFQGKGFRKRHSPRIMDRTDSLTRTYFVRRLSVEGSKAELGILLESLPRGQRENCELTTAGDKTILFFPDTCIAEVLARGPYRAIQVEYKSPVEEPAEGEHKHDTAELNCGASAIASAGGPYSMALENKTSAYFYQSLFVENLSFEKTASRIMEIYGLGEDKRSVILGDIEAFHSQFQEVEYTPVPMPEYD